MPLANVAVAIALTAVVALACAGETPPPTPAPSPTPQSTEPGTQNPAPSTPSPTPTPGPAGPQPPPKDELIKFANWDDNPVKLLNWIAAYIVAHGLDRPIRVIDVEDGEYRDPLLNNDVDVVIAADGEWAGEQAASGGVARLANASPVDAALAVAVHPSMERRAPDVVRMLETLAIDADLLAEHSAMIRGGRVGLKENAVGLIFLKRQAAVWTNWVGQDAAARVNRAIDDGKIGHCRQFINYAPDRMGNEGSRYCKDDPSKTSGNR